MSEAPRTRPLPPSAAGRAGARRGVVRPSRWGWRAAAALAIAAGPAHALTPVQRLEAADLVARCLPAVLEGRPVGTLGLDRARGPVADAVRAARGGEVWASPFGGVLLHQAGPGACTMLAPGADPKLFAFWVERWSNGPQGRMWQGRWFGRLDGTAWRRFRRRGGGPVRVHAITGAERAVSEMRVLRGMGGR